tara:strand:- start:114 stop:314 length:201 start_codon:yes stop_codon:yes gene_type:complete
MFNLITTLEVNQIKDTLEELSALANPSEYSKNEVDEIIELLGSLQPLDTEIVLRLNKEDNDGSTNK